MKSCSFGKSELTNLNGHVAGGAIGEAKVRRTELTKLDGHVRAGS